MKAAFLNTESLKQNIQKVFVFSITVTAWTSKGYETLKYPRNENSIRYKFEDLKFFCMNNVDIFLMSETKLDSSFPDAQFLRNHICQQDN